MKTKNKRKIRVSFYSILSAIIPTTLIPVIYSNIEKNHTFESNFNLKSEKINATRKISVKKSDIEKYIWFLGHNSKAKANISNTSTKGYKLEFDNLKNNGNLKNGDKVKVKVIPMLGYSLNNDSLSETEISVSGLKTFINPQKYELEKHIKYLGINGRGSIKIDESKLSGYTAKMKYPNRNGTLYDGDKVEIILQPKENYTFIEKYQLLGNYPQKKSYKIEITDLKKLITNDKNAFLSIGDIRSYVKFEGKNGIGKIVGYRKNESLNLDEYNLNYEITPILLDDNGKNKYQYGIKILNGILYNGSKIDFKIKAKPGYLFGDYNNSFSSTIISLKVSGLTGNVLDKKTGILIQNTWLHNRNLEHAKDEKVFYGKNGSGKFIASNKYIGSTHDFKFHGIYLDGETYVGHFNSKEVEKLFPYIEGFIYSKNQNHLHNGEYIEIKILLKRGWIWEDINDSVVVMKVFGLV
ncbi:MAG: hypothetical protein HRT99_01220 [Mycoplasmatales bacterium]|nr:hypothetical protein [Mycoplasmatales bacterium]